MPAPVLPAHALPAPRTLLADWTPPADPGVSLVTCCKNREANLLRALPGWLACPEITQVVVVDWGSDRPVADSLAEAGLADPRILVVRVPDEPRWILSYAFNLGFRMAGGALILKADADIVLEPGFFAKNPLPPGSFIAGNWRRAAPGQSFVNGFFLIGRADLMAVKGFNEYITTYGWDDDDLYDRLVAQGLTRVDVAPGTVTHLDHDDAVRLNQARPATPSGWGDLDMLAMYKIRTNRMIAAIMPPWNRDRVMLPFRVTAATPGLVTVARAGASIHLVPPELARTARMLAAREMLAWRAGLRVYDLPERTLDLLLTALPLDRIGALQVELMLAGAAQGGGLAVAVAPRHLVADLDEGALMQGAAALAPLARRLVALAASQGRALVWRGARAQPPAELPPALAAAAYLPSYYGIGPDRLVTLAEVERDPQSPVLRLMLGAADLADGGPAALAAPLAPPVAAPVAPPVAAPPAPPVALASPGLGRTRQRLLIDVQHGLGNRLRALGSAAAVAQATDRDLVLIWQPDHHCQARFGDLFLADTAIGAVLEQSPGPADLAGMTCQSYMEIEPGAAKDAPVRLDPRADAYLRSAYVLNHPASDWGTENRLIRRLRPAPAVADLVARLPGAAEIGLHVRMEGADATALASYDAPDNWTAEGHAAITHWRGQSHYARFMARLDQLFAAQPQARAYLAADRPETYEAFAAAYGPRVMALPRQIYDRSAGQAQYALADLILLAGTRHLLGSNWSSFTEAALRLSVTIATHERAGVDF
jgi:hypothetical protein